MHSLYFKAEHCRVQQSIALQFLTVTSKSAKFIRILKTQMKYETVTNSENCYNIFIRSCTHTHILCHYCDKKSCKSHSESGMPVLALALLEILTLVEILVCISNPAV